MKIGYARVSKDEQDLAPQLHALDAAGCGKVFQDQGVVGGGASAARPGLLAALEMAGEGDTLTVWRIDWLRRSTRYLLQILEDLHRRNIAFQSIMDGIDTNTAGGPHGLFNGQCYGRI